MRFSVVNDELTVWLEGRIDSSSALAVEKELLGILEAHPYLAVRLDMSSLFYISSAGLRVLLIVRKRVKSLVLTEVSP